MSKVKQEGEEWRAGALIRKGIENRTKRNRSNPIYSIDPSNTSEVQTEGRSARGSEERVRR